jgi:hypothetical protein
MKKQIEWSADEYDKLFKFIQKTHKTLVDLQLENDEFFEEDHEIPTYANEFDMGKGRPKFTMN